MHIQSYIRSAIQIISEYDGRAPFAIWLREYFRAHKKFGSKDRRAVGSLCFCYFRLGPGLKERDVNERILAAQFLCTASHNPFLAELAPDWNERIDLPPAGKMTLLQMAATDLFPFIQELSPEIEAEKLALSMLVQPQLFIRVRPGMRAQVVDRLQSTSIPFDLLNGTTIALPNGTNLDGVLMVDKDIVVQDYNSQHTMDMLRYGTDPIKPEKKVEVNSVWDCCAASGGKSILCHDMFPKSKLTVSDIRESILFNLRNRFRRAGISQVRSFVFDASLSDPAFGPFDLVICDAPCSGSGTWSRTPEQLSYFDLQKIDHYAGLQKRIAVHASKAVKKDGHFLYITCSVFQKENEDVVSHITNNTSLRLVQQKYLTGYDRRADTLFTALFIAP